MKATEIIEHKVMDRGAVGYRRAIWEFQRHSVGLAVMSAESLEHTAIASLNAMAEHADRLIVLCTNSAAMTNSLASLHHVDAVHQIEPSELARVITLLNPEVVYSAPGFFDPELPEDAVLIRIL